VRTGSEQTFLIAANECLPPFRFAVFPVAFTASSTTSRDTQNASTPREIQSLNGSRPHRQSASQSAVMQPAGTSTQADPKIDLG
jgi:hypothetical protein